MSAPKTQKSCNHKYRLTSYCGRGRTLEFTFSCEKCPSRETRKATPAERAFHKAHMEPRLGVDIHKVYYDFLKRFSNKEKRSYTIGNKTYSGYEYKGYRWTGCDLMGRVEEWAEKYPNDVRVVGVDDDSYSSSCLVLIEHKTDREYMGTTVVYIPQCTGENPIRFFLYGHHRQHLATTLQQISKAAKPVEKQEQDERLKLAKLIGANIKHPLP